MLFRAIDYLTLIYLGILSLLIAIFHFRLDNWIFYLIIHALYILIVVIIIYLRQKTKSRIIHFLRDTYPLLSIGFFYKELEGLIHIVFPGCFDYLINRLELKVFGVYPTIWLQGIVSPGLTEFFVYFYSSYYFIVIISALAFYIPNRKEEFHEFSVNLMLAYYICFIVFVLFPVEGPRFALESFYTIPLKGYAFSKMHAQHMDTGFISAYRGAAMPSSHIAATFVSLIMMRRYKRRLYYLIFPIFTLMVLSTVYGRYHYVSDAVAGIIVGWLSIFLISRYQNREKSKDLI